MRKRIIVAAASAIAVIAAILLGVCLGSVNVPLGQTAAALAEGLTGKSIGVPENVSVIIMTMRFPRVILAFLTGAALSVSGAVVQSVLCNPLASPFTLGASSGASLGACIAFVTGLSFLGSFTVAGMGIVFSVAAMLLMIAFAAKIDRSLKSGTVVLTGMVLSLFISAAVTLIANVADEKYKQIMKWQTGSFAGRGWSYCAALCAVLALCMVYALASRRELDLLTFGDEQALSAGVSAGRKKAALIILSAVLSGTAVSFAGVIGFVDLIAPHIARRLFGAKHSVLIPMSAVIGGIFTVLCDLAARTVITPNELPVGVVTSLMGAPFFAYVFFASRKKT